jgi:hypothetical protein
MFSDQVWPFCLLQCFGSEINGENFCNIWKYYIPSCIPNLQSHKLIFVERALPHWSLMTANIFRPGLTLLPTTMFCWCHWWESFKAYETTTPPLTFPIGKSTNKSLQRELCNVEVQCIIMGFFLFFFFGVFFFFFLCRWTGIELTVRVMSKKANTPCTEG